MKIFSSGIIALLILLGCGKAKDAEHAAVKAEKEYLFYLHGAVVTLFGDNAINQSMPEWGPYEYLNILDSLQSRGFTVISENRKPDVPDSVYVNTLVRQIDSLYNRGVKSANIVVVGASAGWNIGIHVAARMKNPELRFVLIGGCWPETYKAYEHLTLQGHFLSIIEETDPHGTCSGLFASKEEIRSFHEVMLHTGLSHGFIYKGYREWIDPIIAWHKEPTLFNTKD
jgi:hypothetical protein